MSVAAKKSNSMVSARAGYETTELRSAGFNGSPPD